MIEAEAYLESIRALDARIQMKIRQIQSLRDSLTSIYVSTDSERVSHTPNVDLMADTVATIIRIENEIDKQTSELFDKKQRIICLLDRLKAESANVLSGYYIEGKSTKELSNSLFMTRRQVQRKINKAIEEFQTVLNYPDKQQRNDDDNCPVCHNFRWL